MYVDIESRAHNGNGNDNGFYMELGSGLNIPAAQTFQIRPVEVDYLGTGFGSNHVTSYSAWQENY